MEVRKEQTPSQSETPSAPISDEALKASGEVAAAIEEGRPVQNEQINNLLDTAKEDLRAHGISLSPKEENIWRRFTKKFFRRGEKAFRAEKPGSDEIDLGEYFRTFQYVSKEYGLDDVKLKLGALEGARVVTGFIEGWHPFNIAYRFITQRPHKTETEQLLASAQGKQRGRMFSLEQLTPQESQAVAKNTLKQLAPFLSTFAMIPLSQIDHQVNKQFGKEFMGVRKRINERVANSLFMRDFEFVHDRAPAEILERIERGKQGVLSLIRTTYLDFIPRLAVLGGATIPEFASNLPVALLSVLRLPFLFRGSRAAVAEGLARRKEGIAYQSQLNARVASLVGSLELVKTDDTQKAAEALADAMDSRDEFRHGAERAESEAEKQRKTISQIFNVTVPIVGTGWSLWRDRRRELRRMAQREQAREVRVAELRARGVGPPDERINNAVQSASRMPREGTFSTLGPADTLGGRGLSDFINRLPQIFVPYSQASRSQSALEGHIESFVATYESTIKTAIGDIRQMEEFLGPYDQVDRPDGPWEQARIPVSDVPNFDISVRNLSYKDILHDVSIDIPQGSFVTIKGPKGIGKTTFLRHLMGLYISREGGVQYGGVDIDGIKKYGDQAFTTKIAYANQNPQYFDGMSLKENLVLWSRREVSDDKIRQVLTDLKMEKFAGNLDSKERFHFSGGELRMIGLARALLKDPQIVFLDEPTTHLDQESAKRVMEIVRGLREKQPSMTVVAVTHDPYFEEIAERIVDFQELNKKPETLGEHQVYEAVAEPG